VITSQLPQALEIMVCEWIENGAVRDLKRPRELRALLDREGEVVVTKDGRPFAIMTVPLVTGNVRHFPLPAAGRSES
jgi:hypothetical protein